MERTIKVEGMHCRSCEMLLGDSIGEIRGVGKVVADSRNGTVRVSVSDESSLALVKKTIEREGYKVIG